MTAGLVEGEVNLLMAQGQFKVKSFLFNVFAISFIDLAHGGGQNVVIGVLVHVPAHVHPVVGEGLPVGALAEGFAGRQIDDVAIIFGSENLLDVQLRIFAWSHFAERLL